MFTYFSNMVNGKGVLYAYICHSQTTAHYLFNPERLSAVSGRTRPSILKHLTLCSVYTPRFAENVVRENANT